MTIERRLVPDSRWQSRLRELDALPYNYDASEYAEDQPGWSVDHYRRDLPSEPPGPPWPEQSFGIAKQILVAYQFPDPSRIVGHFDADAKLDGRTMLLEAKFLWMRFAFGVRVSKVIDDRSTEDGQPLSRFGYAYRTLQDHWEIGEITYLLVKNEATGGVQFVIDAYSKRDRIPNIVHRIGFAVFGRRVQKQFAQRCMDRLDELVQRRLESC